MPPKIILASQSPRRKQLLKQIGLDFEVCESQYEEDMSLDKSPVELAEFLSYKKAEEVASHYQEGIVVAGDTMIIFDGKVIGKPKDMADAQQTLEKFSGKKVEVISGLTIWDTASNKKITTHGTGWVKFRNLDKKEIKNYLQAEPEALGFAGSFGALNKGAVLIEEFSGDFYSITGLPLTKLYVGLKKLGVKVFN